VQEGGVTGKEAFEEPDVVLAESCDALVPGRQGALRVRLRVRQPDDPQRVDKPEGIADLARRCQGRRGELQRLLDPSSRLQAVDVRGDPVRPASARERGDAPGQLDVAIQLPAVDLSERLDERRVPRLAGLVVRLPLQHGRPPGVLGRGRGASDEARVTRSGVQPREPPDVGPGRRFEQ
jgi:hypothetical protein